MCTDALALRQPLAGDWRQRVKAAQRRDQPAEPAPVRAARAATSPAVAAPAAAPAAGGAPDLAALSVGLPPGWKPMVDKGSGDVYYGNPATKVGQSGPATSRLQGGLRRAPVSDVASPPGTPRCREVQRRARPLMRQSSAA